MDREAPGCRRMLIATLIITGLMMACLVVTTLGIDGMCVADIGPRMPIYPGATVISERHSMLRPYGMGETVIILYSADDPQLVTGWYGRTVGGALRENLSKGITRQFGGTNWTVTRAEDGTGSQIILYSKCAT